jgi:hypothetical protein
MAWANKGSVLTAGGGTYREPVSIRQSVRLNQYRSQVSGRHKYLG